MLKKEVKFIIGLIKVQKGIYCVILLLLFSKIELYAQNWTKGESKNKWGDITGYSYTQKSTGIALGNKEIQTIIVFLVDANVKDRNYFGIISQTIPDLEFHPAAGFINETITVSFRKDGVTKSYTGSTEASMGNFNQVWMWFTFPSELSNILKGAGQWDVLIEGERWYIRTTIKGNLPSE